MPEGIFDRSEASRQYLVHIVDPDMVTCETLSVIFRLEGFEVSFSVNLAGFFAQVDHRPPDLIIANLAVGNDSALDLIRWTRVLDMPPPVFVLQDRPMVDAAVQVIKAGALEVFTKPLDADFLVQAVRGTLANYRPHLAGLSEADLKDVRGFADLTRREREVLELIASGQSNKEAGRELGISPRTIEVHRARIMEKLGARNTADLLRIIFRR